MARSLSTGRRAQTDRVKPVVICGPSGVGKSTLIGMLRKEYPSVFGFSTSHTTRGIRPGEVDEEDYFFTTKEDMRQRIAAGEFIEHANVHGNLYGTSKMAVERVADKGKVCILDIDIQGVQQCLDDESFVVGAYVFIAPPAHSVLRERLMKRATDSEEVIERRVQNALDELKQAEAMGDSWTGWVVNDDLETAYSELKRQVVPAELLEKSADGDASFIEQKADC